MDGVRIEITGADAALSAVSEAAQQLAEPLMMWEAIGRAMVDSTRRRFDEGSGPGGVPWKPSIRVREEGGKTLIGVDRASGGRGNNPRAEMGIRGGLMGSVTYEAHPGGVRWGSNMRHARIHQLGGTIRAKDGGLLRFRIGDRWVSKESVTIPARPYLGVDEEDAITIEGIALDAIALAFGGAADAH